MGNPADSAPPVEVRPLAEFPEAIPVLAGWHHREWQWLNPGQTIEERIRKLEDSAQPGRIPCTFVAVRDGLPIGSASLVENDMDTRRNLSPWLASVYVAPEFRGGGIGSLLVRRVAREARLLRAGTIHLFTPDRKTFYERLGWTLRETTRYRGETVSVMEKRLES